MEQPTIHYGFRLPYYEDGKFSHFIYPKDGEEENFDLMFDSPSQASECLKEWDLLERAEEENWLLIEISEKIYKG